MIYWGPQSQFSKSIGLRLTKAFWPLVQNLAHSVKTVIFLLGSQIYLCTTLSHLISTFRINVFHCSSRIYFISAVLCLCLSTYFGSNNILAFLLQKLATRIYLYVGNYFHFILVTSSQFETLPEFKRYNQNFTITIELIFSIYGMKVADKLMAFLLRNSYLQKLCSYLNYNFFVRKHN